MPRPSRRKIQDTPEQDNAPLTQAEKANIRSKKWFKENKERRYEFIKEWNKKNPDKIKNYQKKYKMKLRKQVIGYYSAYKYRCACCLDIHMEFLTIDHIKGAGNKHRKEIKVGGGHQFYTWLINNHFPIGYRVLCMNCNHSLGIWGYCPHNDMPESKTMPL